MSHHYSGPNIGFPRGDARLDLTDLYAFPKPGDTDGDAVADIGYQIRFSSFVGGEQSATLRRFKGAQAAETGAGGEVMVEGAPVSTGHEGQVTQAGDHRFFAGWRSDPFFFDVLGTINQFQFTTGDSPREAKQVAEKLLPDLLRYDPKRPASFPDNGRALSDDVSDLFLAILTHGKVTGDNAGPHQDLLDDFPYLGPPHIIRSK